MKKVFELEDLDCAVCAAKIEAAVKELEGVDNVSVNFMTQKMTIETNQNIFTCFFYINFFFHRPDL